MFKNKNKYNIGFIIGILLIVIGLIIVSSNYFNKKKLEAFDKMNILLLDSEIPDYVDTDNDDVLNNEPPLTQEEVNDENEPSVEDPVVPSKKPVDYSKYYVGSIEIPKINLKRGFLDISSPYNNVDKNITVINSSTYPDVDKGNFILAAHSGSSSIGFFNKLHNLELNDLAYINYKNKKYTYKLVNIYTQPKIGMVAIYRDTSKTTLTLVTCTVNTKDKQTIFILELINIE